MYQTVVQQQNGGDHMAFEPWHYGYDFVTSKWEKKKTEKYELKEFICKMNKTDCW
jgi:hypothetical protein